jgi:hypothetical protein
MPRSLHIKDFFCRSRKRVGLWLLQKTTFFVHTQISMLHWQSKEWSIPRSLCSTGSQKSGPYPDLYAPLAVKRVVHTQISLLHGGSQKSRRIVVATKDLHFFHPYPDLYAPRWQSKAVATVSPSPSLFYLDLIYC